MPASEKHLHLISFDVPFPPSYGGVIDVFYKIKELNELGVKVHLHCYQYGREKSVELESICYEVNYYRRDRWKNPMLTKLPYIVNTRNTKRLLQNLMKDNYPILFEGLHSCYHLADEELKDRFKIVRMHNIEHDYYKNLSRLETNPAKKLFFRNESRRLKKFEEVLAKANLIAAISPNDYTYLKEKFAHVKYLPAFHPNSSVDIKEGKGDFILYHGNLGVGENDEAALFLVNKVFNRFDIPVIIAGNNPSAKLQRAVKESDHITLMENVTVEEIHDLVQDAQVNVLPTFQATGIKLKLLNALFQGRFCVVNVPMVENTGLDTLCVVEDSPSALSEEIKQLFSSEFSKKDIELRKEVLYHTFNNKKNGKLLVSMAFS